MGTYNLFSHHETGGLISNISEDERSAVICLGLSLSGNRIEDDFKAFIANLYLLHSNPDRLAHGAIPQ